jgi:cyclophilin family peptidyl-prolyl cis-trans isomerase
VLVLVLASMSMESSAAAAPATQAARVGPGSRLAILQAEDRRAPSEGELATIRAGLSSADAQTVRVAVRALGRLERAALIADVLPLLRHPVAAVRAEAFTAVGQAAQGWKRDPPAGWERELDSLQAELLSRLATERDAGVLAILFDTLGRLPYTTAAQVDIAERALVARSSRRSVERSVERLVEAGQSHSAATESRQSAASQSRQAERGQLSLDERLGIAQGLFRLTRFQRNLHPFSPEARAVLASLISTRATADASAGAGAASRGELAARVRRISLEAYLALGPLAAAGDRALVEAASRDADMQVRRLAARGAAALASHDGGDLLARAVSDSAPLVRLEAVRGLFTGFAGKADEACSRLLRAVGDQFTGVALMALDELGRCGVSAEAVAALAQAAAGVSQAASGAGQAASGVAQTGSASVSAPRSWHRAAHAFTSLAVAAPDRAVPLMPQFAGASIWQLRMYAARAAQTLSQRDTLEALARDQDDNVREVAIDALAKLYAHEADAIYVEQLTRSGNQVVRSAALALAGTPHSDLARAPLQAALQRLIAEGRDNSHDARAAIIKALDSLPSSEQQQSTTGSTSASAAAPPSASTTASSASTSATSASAIPSPARSAALHSDINGDDLRRLANARARITIRGLGAFELTLLPDQAPASVLRFAHLAEAGFYNGLTFHRIVPNFVIQGGSPGANEYVGDAFFMRDEVGLLPQLRGSVGISTRGRDTGDAQIFVNLLDLPRLDHDYTVFAEVLKGLDLVEQILEGDTIDRVEILAPPAARQH